MKKVVLAALVVLCLASFSFAGNWGLGLKVGAGENDLEKVTGVDTEKGYGFAGVELLHEFDLSETNKLGLKVGAETYQKDKVSHAGFWADYQTYQFPITLYYKLDRGVNAFSYYIGGGFTYITGREHDSNGHKYSQNKGFVHAMAGTEYRFTELFALGVDVAYSHHAGLQEVSHHSGFRGALVGRFYF